MYFSEVFSLNYTWVKYKPQKQYLISVTLVK